MRPLRLILPFLLGALTTLTLAWPITYAVFRYDSAWQTQGFTSGVGPWGWGPEKWWIDDDADKSKGWPCPKAGRYFAKHHAMVDVIDFRRIIFMGDIPSLPYYRQNPPPVWAATISTDMREGYEQVISAASGFPFRCFRGEHWISWKAPTPPPPSINLNGIITTFPTTTPQSPPELIKGLHEFTHHTRDTGYIPLTPIWPPLLANTIIWAAPWSLIFFLPGLTRTWIRSRKGRCTSCGYDRTTLPIDAPCPECGTSPCLGARRAPRQ